MHFYSAELYPWPFGSLVGVLRGKFLSDLILIFLKAGEGDRWAMENDRLINYAIS